MTRGKIIKTLLTTPKPLVDSELQGLSLTTSNSKQKKGKKKRRVKRVGYARKTSTNSLQITSVNPSQIKPSSEHVETVKHLSENISSKTQISEETNVVEQIELTNKDFMI